MTNRFAIGPRHSRLLVAVSVVVSLAVVSGLWLGFGSGGGTAQAQTACETGGATPDGGALARDCEVLLGLKSQLAGTATLNWSADLAIASWDGVHVQSGRVTTLNLIDRGLAGTLPPSLSQLTALVSLALNDNQLTGGIPKEWAQLRALSYLNVTGNRLTGGIPKELGAGPPLWALHLAGNQLSGSIPEELGQSATLRHLTVNGNKLSGSLPANLAGLSTLKVSGNAFTGCVPPVLRKVSSNDFGKLSIKDCATPTPTPTVAPTATETSTATATVTPTATATPVTYALTLSAATGGSLSADPAGESHAVGTVVTVTATAADGYGLSSWGDDCAGTPTTSTTCSLTMDADKTATATFTELTCESGPTVPNPSVNSRLVDDCARLLALRDTLSGTGTLNWTPGTAMTSWTGVTVGGSPGRVTKLHLANNGLTGQVSGLIGELTGLTELRLNGNKLTGRLPSKLGQLTRLTHAYIAGNAFAGCVPPLLRTVANNDVVHVGLADCAEPIDVSFEHGPLTAGAYQFRWDDQSVPLIFDIPPGLTLRVDAVVIPEVGEDGSYAPPGLILQHYQGDSWICLDLEDGSECNRWTPSSAAVRESSSPRVRGSSEADVDSLFDRLAESVWMER